MSTKTLTIEALEVLRTLDYDGNSARITAGDLPRHLYEEVNEVLVRLGGKWKGGRTKAHLFSCDPRPLVEDVVENGEMPPNNPYAYFPTPPALADDMVRLADIYPSDRFRVLEPSAGRGAIVDAIRRVAPNIAVDACELSARNRAELEKKGVRIVGDDFLVYSPTEKYRWIVMNPPFAVEDDKKAYLTHVMHAFGMLDDHGILAAILPTGFLHNENKREREFLEFAREYGQVYRNAPETFKESGTMVDTAILVLEKTPHMRRPICDWPNGYVYDFILSIDREMDEVLYPAVEEHAFETRIWRPNGLPDSVRRHYPYRPGRVDPGRIAWGTQPFDNVRIARVDDLIPAVERALEIADQDKNRSVGLWLPRGPKWLRWYAGAAILYYDAVPLSGGTEAEIAARAAPEPDLIAPPRPAELFEACKNPVEAEEMPRPAEAVQGRLFDPETLEVAHA